jgi:hypothetical protein
MCLLTGCKVGEGALSTSGGSENESFLEFVGTASLYKGGITVNVDDTYIFNAKVHNESEGNALLPKVDRFKGEVYAIPTGTHTVTVTRENEVIYRKKIFISTQETKKIILQ